MKLPDSLRHLPAILAWHACGLIGALVAIPIYHYLGQNGVIGWVLGTFTWLILTMRQDAKNMKRLHRIGEDMYEELRQKNLEMLKTEPRHNADPPGGLVQ